MNDYSINLEVKYNGEIFRVIENLGSGHILVVTSEVYKDKKYPMSTFIIPEDQVDYIKP